MIIIAFNIGIWIYLLPKLYNLNILSVEEYILKFILRVLIVGIFFVLVFIPRAVVGVLNYWLLFVALVVVVILYIFNSYYVSKKAVNKIINDTPDFSILCEKVPFDAEGEFTRGRLVVYNSMLLLYKKQKGKVALAWSKQISEIDSLEFAKVSTKKKGFKIICGKEIFEFSTYFLKIDQEVFIKSLDFEM